MGDGVTDDKDMIISIGSPVGSDSYSNDDTVDQRKAGGSGGQLILNDVSFSGERDNTNHIGIGNDKSQGMSYGNKNHSASYEGILEKKLGQLLVALYENDNTPQKAYIRSSGVLEASIGKLDWNSFEWNATDDGDIVISFDADCRNVELKDSSDLAKDDSN